MALLAGHYLRQFRQERGEIDEPLSPQVIECLAAYRWPGNIRELRNVIEAAVLLSNGEPLSLELLPPEMLARAPAGADGFDARAADPLAASTLDEAEREALRRAIVAERGNLTRAAKRLAIAKSTLYLKMQALGLTRQEAMKDAG